MVRFHYAALVNQVNVSRRIPKRPKGLDCKSSGIMPSVGSNPSSPTILDGVGM